MADDTNICDVVLYHLNSFHMYDELKEMIHLQFLANFKRQWKSQTLELNLIVERWEPSGGSVNPNFFYNKVWRSWAQAVCNVIADWDSFNDWNWGHFSNVRSMGVNKLPGPNFQKFTVSLLMFFIHSFVQHLGYYSSPLLLCPPTFTGHTCTNHQKKFGNRHYNLLSIA